MGGTPIDELERLYLAGREAAALDLAVRLLRERSIRPSMAVMESLRHQWPNRLERIHPAALTPERRKDWDSVAALGFRRPTPPDWKPEPPVGIVDFPVLGRGGASDRLVRLQVDVISGRKDRLPSAKQITPAARNAIVSALEAARTLLPQRASFHVTLPDIGIPIDEESLGLPVAIAAISASLKWGISERLILTGCLTAQGVVGAVDGLAKKQHLAQEERPLAELLNPESVPTLSRAVAQVFRSNLAKGRCQYRMLLRREVEQEDVSRYRRVGLATENPIELRKIFVEPELLPDASDKEWRKQERELAQAVEEPGIGSAEQEVRRQVYRAWVGRDFCRGSDGATERLAWKTNYKTHRALIICGELGMGKTTLLARLVLDSLGDSSAADDKSQPAAALPVLVSAADFSSKDDHSLAAFVTRAVQKRWAEAPRDVVAALVDAFHEDRIELFIDGLNELEEAERPELLQRLAAWHATRPAMRCVLTTRPAALAAVAVPQGFRVFHLAGLSEQQGYRMMAHGKPYHDAELSRTLHFIRSQNALREIAANPLLLMLTSRLKTSEIETLRHWVDVYERTMPLLLRGPHGAALPEFDFRLCIRAWSSVADVLQRRGQLTLREHEARQLIGRCLSRSSESRERKVEELLAVATEHGGLLTRRGRHDQSFWHPSFQEYLAAVQWSDAVSESARVDSLLRDWQPLVERRNNHETLRLALGRMAFHQGEAQRRLAVELLTQIANVPQEDSLLDGVWLCLAADASLDGVPVSPRVREQLAIRLSERVRRFDDVQGSERLTRLAARLLTDNAPSTQIIQSLAKLVETPDRMSSEALELTMRLLAAASATDDAAVTACRRMYERVRPANEERRFLYMGGWQADVFRIAALGLLRAGIVPDGAAVLVLGPKDSLSSSYARPDVVNALLSNALAADELRPFLHDEDAAVQAAARCLYAVARPLSPDAFEWMRQCIEKREYTNAWLRIVAERDPAVARQLFEMATASDYEAVRGVLGLLIDDRVDTKLLVSLLVPWLVAQPFSRELVHKLPLRSVNESDGDVTPAVRRALFHQIESVATCGSGPEAARALGWLVSLFGMPTDAARKREWRKRMGAFAAAAPHNEAKDWLSLLVEHEDRALAGVLAARLIRDVDSEKLRPIVRIVDMMDLRKWWPRRVFAAVNARALRAAAAECYDEVLTCSVLTRDHKLNGVARALEIVAAADSGLPSWAAGFQLLRLRRMNRELAIRMLRQIGQAGDGHLAREWYVLYEWIWQNCGDDEGVIRAMIIAPASASSDYRRMMLDDYLRRIITSCPERVNLLTEHLQDTKGAEREQVRQLLSSVCTGNQDSKALIHQQLSIWIDDPDVGPDVVYVLARADVPIDEKMRNTIGRMVQRKDELGQWATEWLEFEEENLSERWISWEAKLTSANLDEVIDAAGNLLRAKRHPPSLVWNLRRCLVASPVQALRAALILYGQYEPISDAVPKLLECLSIHDQTHIFETFWVIKRRRPNVIHVGPHIVISRVQESEEQDDEDTQDAVGDPPPPIGRDRFRPMFGYHESVAQCAASLLAEIECREVIPTLIDWLRDCDDRRSYFARNLLRFLEAESEPGFCDWLLEQVQLGNYGESISASNVLFEADMAPARHLKALLASFPTDYSSRQWSAGCRILILCATREDAARAAEETMGSLDVEKAWLLARWLIGVGRSSAVIAAAYVSGEIKLPNTDYRDPVTARLARSEKKEAWHALFDENRLHSDEHVLREFAVRLGDSNPTERAHAACAVIAWLGKSRHILDENPQSISLVGPLREPLLAALRAGLDGDDIAFRCYAIDHLDRLGCFDDTVLSAAILCLHEVFGGGPSRHGWGEPLSESDWESAALEDRLDVARVLIGRGLKTEPIKMLTRFVAQPTENLYFDYCWMKALKLLVECGTEQALVRQVLASHLERTRFPFHHFRELLPLLQQVNGCDALLRSLILEQFAQGDTLSTYLIRQWAHREFVYAEHDEQESNNVEGARGLGCQIPMGGTALDVRTAQIKWLAAQNVPPERIRPAMVLLAVRYDEERATRMTQAIIDRRTDTTARELVERDLASDESDGQGQQLSKAWLLAALTDAAHGVC